MISLYRKLYTEYSSKYGEKTCILLMVGKFYELYDFVDSNGNTTTSICSAVERMNIALSEEPNKGPNGETLLKAGIPEQTLHKFAQVLTQDGWTIVVVDQVKEKDRVVDRITTRILSPGTHHETATRQRLSLAALCIQGSFALSLIDIPTGEMFSHCTSSPSELLHMMQVYNVKEILVKQSTYDEATLRSMFGIHCALHLSKTPIDRAYASDLFREELFSSLTKSLAPLSLPFPRNVFLEQTLCTLLQFVKDHFPHHSIPVLRHTMHNPNTFVQVNNNLLEQINYITYKEGQTSILDLLEKTRTAIGARALRERMLRPITCETELERRWGHVEWGTRLLTDPTDLHGNVQRNLKGMYDLPRLHTKLSAGCPTALDILQLFQSYAHTECLLTDLADTPLSYSDAESVREYRAVFTNSFDEDKANRRQNGEFVGYLRSPKTIACETEIQELLDGWKKTWTTFCKANHLPQSGSFERKDGELQFECPRSMAKGLDALQTKPITYEMKKSGPLILHSPTLTSITSTFHDLCRKLETTLTQELRVLCDTVWSKLEPIQEKWIDWIGYVDCTITLASVAVDQVWVRPSISTELNIKGLRHPLIESRKTRLAYVKHDVTLGSPGGWLLYGVNASGKSSLMKAVGISVLLAQAGSFVPADTMSLRPYHSLFSRIWSHDNVWTGLSSFAVEVGELRDILEGANDRSLVLGDEVCSGTESISATALVASTLEHLDEKKAHFLFATHLHDLLKVPGCLPRPGIAVFHLRVIRTLDGKLIYDRTLHPGSGSSTYGLEVAKAMNLPFACLERAYAIRNQLIGETAVQSSWNSELIKKTCELCGSTTQLEVHHIQHREHGGNNQVRNLIVLCDACHDKHHAGKLEIPPLQQTSEGQERVSIAASVSEVKSTERSQDEVETITSTLRKYKGRPPERISAALQEEGISIKIAELKRFIRKG